MSQKTKTPRAFGAPRRLECQIQCEMPGAAALSAALLFVRMMQPQSVDSIPIPVLRIWRRKNRARPESASLQLDYSRFNGTIMVQFRAVASIG